MLQVSILKLKTHYMKYIYLANYGLFLHLTRYVLTSIPRFLLSNSVSTPTCTNDSFY